MLLRLYVPAGVSVNLQEAASCVLSAADKAAARGGSLLCSHHDSGLQEELLVCVRSVTAALRVRVG